MNIFTEVKSRVSAAEVAKTYGLKINRNMMACCPFHDDKHPSMKIDQTYYCFGCGEKGYAINYVAKTFGLSQIEAAKKIIQDFHLPIESEKREKRKRKTPESIKKRKELENNQVEEIKKRFHKWCTDKCHTFLDLLNLIQTVKESLADKHPEVIMNDDAFAVMLHAEPKLNHWMDILCFGTEEEQKEFFLQERKGAMELEEQLFRAGKAILDRDWNCIEQRKCG